jgi:hypothetical protein
MQQLLDVFANFTQVRVVFGYRRFFEWIVSEYHEEMKFNIHDMTKDRPVLAFCDWYAQQLYSTSPHNAFAILDGAALHDFKSSFPRFRCSIFMRTTMMILGPGLLDGIHKRTKSSSSSSSSLSPMNSIMANFLCHMIPEAQHGCEAARAETLVPAADEEDVFKRNLSMDNVDAYYIAEQVAQKLHR